MSGVGPAVDGVVMPAMASSDAPPVAGASTTAAAQAVASTTMQNATPPPSSVSTTPAVATEASPPPAAANDAPASQITTSTPSSNNAAAASRAVTFPIRGATQAQVAAKPVAPAGVDAGSIGGAVFSLLLIIGLILGLGWLARRMPGMKRGGGASQLKVVASVALSARDRAVVVDVGGQQLLVGVGPGGVRTLHTLERPLPVDAMPSTPSPFAQVLAQHFGKKP